MTPLAWILGLVLPACAAEGAGGLPVPGLMDITRIERPSTPNTFLAGPAGMTPTPDLVIAEQNASAGDLFNAIRSIAERQPRSYTAAVFPDRMQVHYVVRSALLNFPDLVTIQAGPARGTLIIWSRSVYGRRDFGVNMARTEAWLAALPFAAPHAKSGDTGQASTP